MKKSNDHDDECECEETGRWVGGTRKWGLNWRNPYVTSCVKGVEKVKKDYTRQDVHDKDIRKKVLGVLNKRFETSNDERMDAHDAIEEACIEEALTYFKDPDEAEEVGLRIAEGIKFVPAKFK